MGGRKSHKVEIVVGKSKEIIKRKSKFIRSFASEEPDNIIQSAIDLFSSSSQVVDNLYQATKLLDFVKKHKEKKTISYKDRKEVVAKKWANIKKKEKLETSSEADRILIESAAKVIRRGRK